jgi:hypothetical protein
MLHHGAAVDVGEVAAQCAGGQRLIPEIVEDLPPDRRRERLEYRIILVVN